VPVPTESGYYRPRIRMNNGTYEFISECDLESPYTLPCVYTVRDDDGVTGINYTFLAWKFYRAYEKNNQSLDQWIANANLKNCCSYDPVRLFPGVRVVIPTLP
jgi:hypothetical protein